MASRPTRTTRSRAPSTEPTQPHTTRVKTPKPSSSVDAPAPAKPPSKTAATRKPLLSKSNSSEINKHAGSMSSLPSIDEGAHIPGSSQVPSASATAADDREPIKAYLRIRPHVTEGQLAPAPYLEPLSDTTVRMADPGQADPSRARLSSRHSLAAGSHADYTFTHVFPPATAQAEFFTRTTLPLVRDLLLDGQNGLLFAYGVTNSGKTYTVQGGAEQGAAGILPRTLDVIFNSIGSMQGEGRYRPVRLQGIEPNDDSEPELTLDELRAAEPALGAVLDSLPEEEPSSDIDPAKFTLDRNHEYTVWLSYAEVYNERVYDLLVPSTRSGLPRPTTFGTAGAGAPTLARKALTVKSSPPADAWDPDAAAGKYVDGIRHVRVQSAAQAKAVLRLGQLHRRVFGTLANSQSSRSHAVVTIKLLRQHRGERNNPSAIQVSRLTLVDLAGSERTRNTQTSGERLKEAGSINKSLMVLGQCLETLRANQRRLAQSLGGGGRSDTRDVRKALQVVPFRHSKMTEMLMDYFVGDGRVVMIVNVNPFDTGFDENAHVMRFAAIAREVTVASLRPPSPTKLPMRRVVSPSQGSAARPEARRRSVTLQFGGARPSQTLEVLEEDEEVHSEDQDDDISPADNIIRELFEENDDLRAQLFETEMRCALVEAEVREEVMGEMEARMRRMEETYRNRLVEEAQAHERKMEAKIRMLYETGAFNGSPRVHESEDVDMDGHDDLLEEEHVEKSLIMDEYVDEDREETAPPPEPSLSPGATEVLPSADSSPSPPPPPATTNTNMLQDQLPIDLPPVEDSTPAAKAKSKAVPEPGPEDMDVEAKEEAEVIEISEDEYVPPPSKAKSKGKGKAPVLESDDNTPITAPRRFSKISLADMDDLERVPGGDDSVLVIPNRKARAAAIVNGGPDVTYIPRKGEVDVAKKRKRQLVKKPVVTEDQIDRLVGGTQDTSGRPVRRMVTRGS